MKNIELKMWNDSDKLTFCRHCGRELKMETYSPNFDVLTGKPVINYVLYCPKFRFKFLSHYTFFFDENGEEIIERYD